MVLLGRQLKRGSSEAQVLDWSNLTLVTDEGAELHFELGLCDQDRGGLRSALPVLERASEPIHHFRTAQASLGSDQGRGLDLASPAWHLLDVLPRGRGRGPREPDLRPTAEHQTSSRRAGARCRSRTG